MEAIKLLKMNQEKWMKMKWLKVTYRRRIVEPLVAIVVVVGKIVIGVEFFVVVLSVRSWLVDCC